MGVQFILGRSGAGKTRWCIASIVAALQQKDSCPLIFLVPEQATYQAERAILSAGGVGGYHRLYVLSFGRLAFLLCGRGSDLFQPTSLGRRMIISRILEGSAGQLKTLGPAGAGPGLAGELAGLCSRLFQQEIEPQDLLDTAKAVLGKNPDNLTGRKLADLALVFEKYLAFLAEPDNSLINPDAGLRLAREKVRQARFCNGALVWVDGFSGFTVQQRALLTELLTVCRQGHIALCLDPKEPDTDDTASRPADNTSLFCPTQRTYAELLGAFESAGISTGKPIALEQARRFEQSPALGHIERYLFTYDKVAPISANEQIEIAAAADIRAECQWVAGKIRRLVMHCGYRYRDIAVIVPRMELYGPYLNWAMKGCQIPCFMDQPKSMRSHPLVEMINCALEAAAEDFEQVRMLAYLKTGLAGIDGDQADILDNFCRACGISGRDWLTEDCWQSANLQGTDYDPHLLNSLRHKVMKPLLKLRKSLFSQEYLTAAEFTRAIWNFLEELDISAQLARWIPDDCPGGESEHHQLWRGLVEVFDELCLIFPAEAIEAARWISIITGALETLTLKMIPPSLDQVLIGSVERSRHPDLAAVFLVGVTQKDFPSPLSQNALLSEADISATGELFADEAIERRLAQRRYLAYIALSRAGEKLFLSYPLLDESLSTQTPWPSLERLSELVEGLKVAYPSSAPLEAHQVKNRAELADWLARTLGPDNQAPPDVKRTASELLQLLCGHSDSRLAETGGLVRDALGYRNQAVLESAEYVNWPMHCSVTRLETFAACPYKHFARYILGLRQRQMPDLEPVDVGRFYHDVLDRMFKSLVRKGLNWQDASEAELAELCQNHAQQLLADDTRLKAFSRQSAHHRYLLTEAVENLVIFTKRLKELCTAGAFRQICSEYRFGTGSSALELDTGGGRVVRLRGYIDRIDCARIDNKCLGLVYDYKRTGRGVNWAKMLHGLDMQLLTYLLAVQDRQIAGQTIEQTAGAFFLPVEPKLDTAEPAKNTSEKFRHKPSGVFDGRFAEYLDPGAKDSGWSRYFSFRNTKEAAQYGDYGKTNVLKPEDFELLLRFSRKKIIALAGSIASGRIEIQPYKLGTESPCSRCDYNPVCRFDWLINEYNPLTTVGKIEAIEQMKGRQL